MKSARRRSRELVVQGLYQWLLSSAPVDEIDAQIRVVQGFEKADEEHFVALLRGVIRDADFLTQSITPSLDRPIAQLSPVERAVLLMASFELANHLEIPYRVVINEAVEVAKTYGGADGYKYVNGVLDKVAVHLRPDEAKRARAVSGNSASSDSPLNDSVSSDSASGNSASDAAEQ